MANRDVSLAIEPREIVGLIGPNGAGKTTLFNCISGALHPDEGRIVLDGTDISRARPERSAASASRAPGRWCGASGA